MADSVVYGLALVVSANVHPPRVLGDKLTVLRATLDREIPDYRGKHGI